VIAVLGPSGILLSCGSGACEALSERSTLSLVFPICTQGGLLKGQSSLLESSMEYLYTSGEGRCSYAIGRPVIELEICLTPIWGSLICLGFRFVSPVLCFGVTLAAPFWSYAAAYLFGVTLPLTFLELRLLRFVR
jgi:hypothetical protein